MLRSFEFVKPLILGMMQVLTLKLKEKKNLKTNNMLTKHKKIIIKENDLLEK